MADNPPSPGATAPRLLKTVVLVGMMGCGKTAVGTELARQLAVPFLDSDAEIEKAANAPVAEIFARHGEPFFRDKESRVLERLLQGAPCILSTGGGAFLAQRNRDLIAAQGVSVWLQAPLEVLWARVRHKTTRPLLMTENPRQTLSDLLDARQPSYELAHVAVPTDGKVSIPDMAQRVVHSLIAYGTVIQDEKA